MPRKITTGQCFNPGFISQERPRLEFYVLPFSTWVEVVSANPRPPVAFVRQWTAGDHWRPGV